MYCQGQLRAQLHNQNKNIIMKQEYHAYRILTTLFSTLCFLHYTKGISKCPHSPLFIKGSYFKRNLALISLTSSLSPLPFSFDCYSRKSQEYNPCLSTECAHSLNSLALPSIQPLLRRARPHRARTISAFAAAFSSSHAAGCYCISPADSTSPLPTLFPLQIHFKANFPSLLLGSHSWECSKAGGGERSGELLFSHASLTKQLL